MKAASLLHAHRTALETMLDMNAAAPVDRVTRLILDGLDRQARHFLRRITRAETDLRRSPENFERMTLGEFGENQFAPAIRDICKQAEFHRAMAATKAQRKAA